MKWLDFIVCDDIRHELRNKVTIVGAYGDAINFDVPNSSEVKWPIGIKLGLYARLVLDLEETFPSEGASFDLQISHGGNEIAKVEGNISPKDAEPLRIVALGLVAGVGLPGTGKLSFRLVIRNREKVLFDDRAPFDLIVRVRQIQ